MTKVSLEFQHLLGSADDDPMVPEDAQPDYFDKVFETSKRAAAGEVDVFAAETVADAQRDRAVSRHYHKLAKQENSAGAIAKSTRKVARTERDGATTREYDAAGRLVREISHSNYSADVVAEFNEDGTVAKTFLQEL